MIRGFLDEHGRRQKEKAFQKKDVTLTLIKARDINKKDPFVNVSCLEGWNVGFQLGEVVDDITGAKGQLRAL